MEGHASRSMIPKDYLDVSTMNLSDVIDSLCGAR